MKTGDQTVVGDALEERPDPHYRRNWLCHALDGWLIGGGFTFISMGTVLPALVRTLGGSAWLISLIPMMGRVGASVTPLLTAHRFDARRRFMPVVILSGVFLRLPYFIAAFALLALAGRWPGVALACVLLAPLASGTAWGLASAAWWQLVVRTVPQHRRASLMAIRTMGAGIIGLGAGWAVKSILSAVPGPTGYGILYVIASVLGLISFGAFMMIRERPEKPPPGTRRHTMVENVRSFIPVVRGDRQFAMFLASVALMNGALVLTPFLPLRALARLGVDDSYVGELLFFQTLGMVIGNPLLGWLGDRLGGKAMMVVSRAGLTAVALCALTAATPAGFRVTYAVLGLSLCAWMLGQQILVIELCPPDRRSSYLAIVGLVQLPAMLAVYAVSASLGEGESAFAVRAWVAAACTFASLLFVLRLREPRRG